MNCGNSRIGPGPGVGKCGAQSAAPNAAGTRPALRRCCRPQPRRPQRPASAFTAACCIVPAKRKRTGVNPRHFLSFLFRFARTSCAWLVIREHGMLFVAGAALGFGGVRRATGNEGSREER